MAEESVIEALLDHGITHYTFCPWDFHTHLMLYAEAKKVMGDKELAKQVANHFIDVTADTYCVKKRFTDIPELHRVLKKGEVEKVIASLYEKIWGIDLGVLDSKTAKKGHRGDRPPSCADSLSGSVPVAGEYEKICPISKAPPPGRTEGARGHGRKRRQ